MNKEDIKENYSNFSTEKLINLVSEIRSLKPENLPILQNELINRNESKVALGITEYLTSIKYHTSEQLIFDNMITYRKLGMTPSEINDKLKKDYGISLDYIQSIRISLREKGKENIINGILLIIIPLVFGVILISKGEYAGIVPFFVIIKGIFILNKGIMQKKTH